MSTITRTNRAIADVARMYLEGIAYLLDFIFTDILPPRAILRILITAYLLTRAMWFQLGEADPESITIFYGVLGFSAGLAIVEFVVKILMALAVDHTRWLIARFRRPTRQGSTHQDSPHNEGQAGEDLAKQKLARLFRDLKHMPGPIEDPGRWN